MARYVITSPRLGPLGAPYSPADGINVQALLDGGFIREDSDSAPDKPTKLKTKRPDTEPTE